MNPLGRLFHLLLLHLTHFKRTLISLIIYRGLYSILNTSSLIVKRDLIINKKMTDHEERYERNGEDVETFHDGGSSPSAGANGDGSGSTEEFSDSKVLTTRSEAVSVQCHGRSDQDAALALTFPKIRIQTRNLGNLLDKRIIVSVIHGIANLDTLPVIMFAQ
uniref:Uncharacterized protein n=1 Tax=Helianthus annuus TaxID=4232 RepID=A0A251T2C5_HELAN